MGSNINQFIKETNAEIKKLQEKQVKEAKELVLAGYSEITHLSPVKDGLFIHNNLITVNKKSSATTTEEGTNKQEVINDAIPIIYGAKFKHGDTITIQNHLAYADRIEGTAEGQNGVGWSSQAPIGVYGVAEERIRKKINKRVKI